MNVEHLIDDILSDQLQIKDLDLEQMEAIVDYMREHISTIPNEEYRDALLVLVDAVEIAAENRFAAAASGDWDDVIEDSMARGNTYFELENPIIH